MQIASTGLAAHRTRLEVAGNNVANVSTPGYARRRVLVSALPSVINFDGKEPGLGVLTENIQRMGDRLLLTQINLEMGYLGRAAAFADSATHVESVVAGPDGRGLLDPLNALFDAFADVAADPGAMTPRNMVVTPAEALSDAFTRIDGDLQKAIESNDAELVETVRRVNQLAEQVATINIQIGQAGCRGAGLELEEQRELAIQQLAELCGATGVTRDNGTVDVLIGGHYLVQADEVRPVQLVEDPAHSSLHTVSFANETPPSRMEGKLIGLLDARATTLDQARSELNTFAATFADAINAVHAAGYGLDGTTGLDLFIYDPAAPAATLQLNPAITADPTLIAAASRPDEPANGENALALENLRQTPPAGMSNSLLDTHTDFLAAIGHSINMAVADREARQTVASSLEARYQAVAGVSLDEEAIALESAQQAYLACQRAFQVALEVIDALIATV